MFSPKRSHQHDSKLILLTYHYCPNRKSNHQIHFFSHQLSWEHLEHLYATHKGHHKGHKQLYSIFIISMSLFLLAVLNKHHDQFFYFVKMLILFRENEWSVNSIMLRTKRKFTLQLNMFVSLYECHLNFLLRTPWLLNRLYELFYYF